MIFILLQEGTVYCETRTKLRSIWAQTTHQMQMLRDNPECVMQELALKQDPDDPGLTELTLNRVMLFVDSYCNCQTYGCDFAARINHAECR